MLPVHSLPPPPAQSIVHADALVQSMSPQERNPQSISQGTPAGHVVFVRHALLPVQSKTHVPFLHVAFGAVQTDSHATGAASASASAMNASVPASFGGMTVTSFPCTSGAASGPELPWPRPLSSRLHPPARATARRTRRIDEDYRRSSRNFAIGEKIFSSAPFDKNKSACAMGFDLSPPTSKSSLSRVAMRS